MNLMLHFDIGFVFSGIDSLANPITNIQFQFRC